VTAGVCDCTFTPPCPPPPHPPSHTQALLSPRSSDKVAGEARLQGVSLHSAASTPRGVAVFLSSTTTRIPDRSLSSLKSAMPSMAFSFTKSATFSTNAALFVWYGSCSIGKGTEVSL